MNRNQSMVGRLLGIGLLVCLMCGCTHVQLRKNAVREAGAISDFHRQQVLNNLAMFAYDYHALPFFSFPNQTSANVTDQGTIGLTPGFARPTGGPAGIVGHFLFSTLGITATGQRQAQEGFVVTPINEPRKLELMRCAYQKALSNCGRGPESTTCPDCKTRLNVFYTGDPDGDIRAKANGIVSSECMDSCCWLKFGCEKCVPKGCPCDYVGSYCGVTVWVPPEGRDEFTKLVLMILDFALHDPPVRLSKQVVYNIDEFGLPTDTEHAVGVVAAQVAVNERNDSLLSMPKEEQARLLQLLDGRLDTINLALETAEGDERTLLTSEKLLLERKIDFLNSQFPSAGLKDQFMPMRPSGIAPFSVAPLLQQNLNTLTPQPPSLR